MKYIISIIICAFFVAGCKSASQDTLSGQPSWFRATRDRSTHSETETPVLIFEPYPYWFCAFDRWVDEATAKAYVEEYRRKHHGDIPGTFKRDGMYGIPSELPYPAGLENVSLDDDGVTLSFCIRPTSNPAILVFDLTLHSTGRTVWREGEKDAAGLFLFALFADGKAVQIEHFFHEECGTGDPAPAPVVFLRKNETRTITLKVDASSIDGLPSISRSKTLQVVVAFSERLSDIYIDESKPFARADFGPMHLEPPASEDGGAYKQVLVRSNAVILKWNGKAWMPEQR
jgi:hypothetical protein